MKKGAVYAEVGEGEGLFIPEGWWHQITSSPGTVAVNVWFKVTSFGVWSPLYARSLSTLSLPRLLLLLWVSAASLSKC